MTDKLTRLVRVRHLAATGEARRCREAARLSLGDIANSIKVGRSTILRWETGERRPTGPAALRYLAALDAIDRLVKTTEP